MHLTKRKGLLWKKVIHGYITRLVIGTVAMLRFG